MEFTGLVYFRGLGLAVLLMWIFAALGWVEVETRRPSRRIFPPALLGMVLWTAMFFVLVPLRTTATLDTPPLIFAGWLLVYVTLGVVRYFWAPIPVLRLTDDSIRQALMAAAYVAVYLVIW